VDVQSPFWISFFAGSITTDALTVLANDLSLPPNPTVLQLRIASRVTIRKLFRALCNIRGLFKLFVFFLSISRLFDQLRYIS